MSRTEPTKEGNDSAVAELKRELRGELPLKYRDARAGATSKIRTFVGESGIPNSYCEHGYTVRASDEHGQSVEVAFFALDDFDEGKRRETARMLAEELADRINNA